MADAVLNNMDLLSNVIKCALESNAQAPTLASVAQLWNGQLCFWKQQIVLKSSLSNELKSVLCIDSGPVALLHGWGAPPRNLLVGMPQPTISPVFDAFQALGEKFPDRITTREDVLTLLDLPGGGMLWWRCPSPPSSTTKRVLTQRNQELLGLPAPNLERLRIGNLVQP